MNWFKVLVHIFFLALFQPIPTFCGECPKPPIKSPKVLMLEEPRLLDKFFQDGEKVACDVDEILITDISDIPSDKFFSLLGKTTNLIYLAIQNSTIKDFPATSAKRVKLPNLRVAGLDLNCKTKYTKEELAKVLFFDLVNPWKLEDLSQLKVNVDVYCNEVPHLSLNHKHKWFRSEYSYTNDLISKMKDFGLLSLDLAECDLNVDLIPKSIALLLLHNVVLKNGNLVNVLKSCTALEEVAVSTSELTSGPVDKETQDFLNGIGIKNHTHFWIMKKENKDKKGEFVWSEGVAEKKKKSKKPKSKSVPRF